LAVETFFIPPLISNLLPKLGYDGFFGQQWRDFQQNPAVTTEMLTILVEKITLLTIRLHFCRGNCGIIKTNRVLKDIGGAENPVLGLCRYPDVT
jgi:hypothetical protein